MAFMPEKQTTSIATHTNDDIFIRDKSLCGDLIGKLSFTQMAFFQITGRMASEAELLLTLILARALLHFDDACEREQVGEAVGLADVEEPDLTSYVEDVVQ